MRTKDTVLLAALSKAGYYSKGESWWKAGGMIGNLITRAHHSRAVRGHSIKAFQPKREICLPLVERYNPPLTLRLEEGDISARL